MIGCALAGAAAGVNLAGVVLLAYLWYQGRRDLQELLRDLAATEEARAARRAAGAP